MKSKVFPENHLAKYANIPALYEEAMKRGIIQEKFYEFIYNELSKNAQQWVSMRELNKIRKKSTSRTRKQGRHHPIAFGAKIETIIEEEDNSFSVDNEE